MLIPERLERLLRYLTIGEEATLDQLLCGQVGTSLDRKTSALVVVAALVGVGADGPSYQSAIDAARAEGADDEQILETVIAIAPLVGEVRLGSAVPALNLAIRDGAGPD